uniref:RNase H type-1 domain-containing protein n=1 Tax=Cannabis sativa TaxID=3483 RepID=A0A803PC56_CANSA
MVVCLGMSIDILRNPWLLVQDISFAVSDHPSVANRNVFSLIKNWNSEVKHRVVMLCWALWSVRNGKAWNDKNKTVKETAHLIAPIGNTIKINIDAAIFSNLNRHGYGWVARDSSSQLILAQIASEMGVTDHVLAGAIRVKEVLSWSYREDMVLESDSLITIQAARNLMDLPSTFRLCISKSNKFFLV